MMMMMMMMMSPRTNFFRIESIQGRKFWYSEISENSTFLPINADVDNDDRDDESPH